VSADDPLYPPTPADVPDELTALSPRYRRLVKLVGLSLILFFLVYLGLLFGSAALAVTAVLRPARSFPPPAALWRTLEVLLGGFVFLFLLKGLLRPGRAVPPVSLELTEEDQPELFRFIRQLCADTGAPVPHRVFVMPEVNAAAFCEPSLLSLLGQVRPNLIIGLGLVNGLTLDQFKAVLAHEFGHFSLRGMPLGRYVYVANRILAHTALAFYGWERWLASAARRGVGEAVLVAAPFALLWLMRQVLWLVFKGINLSRLALAREEEFHADSVAVGAAGSGAVIGTFGNVSLASNALFQTVHELAGAAGQRLYSRDLFFHHGQATERLRRQGQDKAEDEETEDDRALVVGDEAEAVPPLWADHPPDEDRIRNAKRLPVVAPADGRSPWVLFDRPEGLRVKMTRRWYRVIFKVKKDELGEPEAVQSYLDGERAETTYDPRYHGLYDHRLLEPGPMNGFKAQLAEPWSREQLVAVLDGVTGAEAKERMDRHCRRRKEQRLLQGLLHGRPGARKKRHFEFRGETHRSRDKAAVKKLLAKVDKELEKDRKHFSKADRDVLMAHYQMADCVDGARAELRARYDFHLALQELLALLECHQGRVNAVLAVLAARGQIQGEAAQRAIETFREARDALQYSMRVAKQHMEMPALHGVTAGERFGLNLLDEEVISDPMFTSRTIEAWWAKRFLKQLGTVRPRLLRFHFKSLGGILALQERIAKTYFEGAASP
jgi:Zn-dependent protease with chaperone function